MTRRIPAVAVVVVKPVLKTTKKVVVAVTVLHAKTGISPLKSNRSLLVAVAGPVTVTSNWNVTNAAGMMMIVEAAPAVEIASLTKPVLERTVTKPTNATKPTSAVTAETSATKIMIAATVNHERQSTNSMASYLLPVSWR